MKPDLCIFSQLIPDELIKNGYEKFIAHFGFMELCVEVKIDPIRSDPFEDPELVNSPGHNFFRKDDSRCTLAHNLGQITSYASEICARQHRTHCFSISIYGTKSRLFRWDRAGVIVSREFDLHSNPELLCLFVWRYSHATDEQRGFDTTVTKATHEEEMNFKEVVTKHIREQLSPADDELAVLVNEHYEPNAVFKIPIIATPPPERKKMSSIRDLDEREEMKSLLSPYPWEEVWEEEGPSNDDAKASSSSAPTTLSDGTADDSADPDPNSRCRDYKGVQYFLVSVPVSAPLTVATRGTRGYWAVKVPNIKLREADYVIAFLKDTWRINVGGMEIEGEVIIEMIEAGVKFISDIFCHGDVPRASFGQDKCT